MAKSGLVRTPSVRLPSGSTSYAKRMIDCVATSVLQGTTARMLGEFGYQGPSVWQRDGVLHGARVLDILHHHLLDQCDVALGSHTWSIVLEDAGTSINVRCSSSGPFFSIHRTSFVNVRAFVLVSASVLMPSAVAACFWSAAVRALVKAGR